MTVSEEAARARRDPFYRDVITEWGESMLRITGYFDDGSTRADLHETTGTPFFCTPTHKLTRSPDHSRPVVLLATGAFSPLHQGHLDMLLSARRALEANGDHVAGAYLSPSHDRYVSAKLGREALPADERLALIRRQTTSYDWITACPWESQWVANPVNFTTVLLRLQNHLRRTWDRACDVALVVGADNSEFARCFARRGRCVIVARGGHETRVAAVLDDPGMAPALRTKRVLTSPGLPGSAFMSSTKLRAAAAAPTTGGPSGRPGADAGSRATRRYAVRDDLAWAARRWRASVPAEILEPALAEFRDGVLTGIRAALNGPGGRPVRVDLLDHEEQRDVAARLCAENTVVSLDPSTPATHRLGISRLFFPSDGQLRPHAMVARPGWPAPSEQVAKISAKSVVLMDDDIWTGASMEYASALLEQAGIEVERTISLMSEITPDAPRPVDLIDLRDLLVGADDSGLVVQQADGVITRAPYLPPFVDLTSRASIPPAEVRDLGSRIWAANAVFFGRTGLRVGDASAAVRRFLHGLGYRDGALLSAVCDAYRRRTAELPFSGGSDPRQMLRNPPGRAGQDA
ncbi:hypothetical protein [Streptomyces sp. NBC_00158]|uniref:hypothetical protein n=1 Tax=Streptomyces sp. NBC_00158 TaxID=2903627 RepID=UPI002F913DEF